jgi:hypothetical protein
MEAFFRGVSVVAFVYPLCISGWAGYAAYLFSREPNPWAAVGPALIALGFFWWGIANLKTCVREWSGE